MQKIVNSIVCAFVSLYQKVLGLDLLIPVAYSRSNFKNVYVTYHIVVTWSWYDFRHVV